MIFNQMKRLMRALTTNDEMIKALTTEQIIRRHFEARNCRERFLGREFPVRVSNGKTAQSDDFGMIFLNFYCDNTWGILSVPYQKIELWTKLQKTYFVILVIHESEYFLK